MASNLLLGCCLQLCLYSTLKSVQKRLKIHRSSWFTPTRLGINFTFFVPVPQRASNLYQLPQVHFQTLYRTERCPTHSHWKGCPWPSTKPSASYLLPILMGNGVHRTWRHILLLLRFVLELTFTDSRLVLQNNKALQYCQIPLPLESFQLLFLKESSGQKSHITHEWWLRGRETRVDSTHIRLVTCRPKTSPSSVWAWGTTLFHATTLSWKHFAIIPFSWYKSPSRSTLFSCSHSWSPHFPLGWKSTPDFRSWALQDKKTPTLRHYES